MVSKLSYKKTEKRDLRIELSEDSLFLMSLLNKIKTNLPFNVYVTICIEGQPDIPRCMFQKNRHAKLLSLHELIHVSISDSPCLLAIRDDNFGLTDKELQLGFDYIKRSYDLLKMHYYQEIDDYELKLNLSLRGMYRIK